MKEYLYSLSITSQFYFCGIPFRLDTSPKCTLNCLYCFARSRGGRRTSKQLISNPESLARKLGRSINKPTTTLDVNGEFLNKRVPLHFGGISDPFSNRLTSAYSRRMLEILANFDYPVVLSTKNTNELITHETFKILKRLKSIVLQVSFSTSRKEIAKVIEPNAPSPKDRLRSIHILSNEGFNIIVRLQPLFPSLIKETTCNLIPALEESGVNHVTVEFIKFPVEHNNFLLTEMSKELGWNDYSYFIDNNAELIGREWLLQASHRWDLLQPVIEAINSHGMTYGAADYGLNHLGDTDCCCGFDGLEGFKSWFKGNFANILRNNETDVINFESVMKYWFPKKSIKRYMNSNCRLDGDNSIIAYLHDKWNRPGTINAPDTYLGINWSGEYDSQGNCVYIRTQINPSKNHELSISGEG